MRQIGECLSFPNDCAFLGDKTYPNGNHVVTPFTAAQLRRVRDARHYSKFNLHQRRHSVVVENAIAHIKVYKAICSGWGNPRRYLSETVYICAALVSRRKDIGFIL